MRDRSRLDSLGLPEGSSPCGCREWVDSMPRERALTALVAAPYLALFALAVANVLRDGPGSMWTIVVVLGVICGALWVATRRRRSRDTRTPSSTSS